MEDSRVIFVSMANVARCTLQGLTPVGGSMRATVVWLPDAVLSVILNVVKLNHYSTTQDLNTHCTAMCQLELRWRM